MRLINKHVKAAFDTNEASATRLARLSNQQRLKNTLTTLRDTGSLSAEKVFKRYLSYYGLLVDEQSLMVSRRILERVFGNFLHTKYPLLGPSELIAGSTYFRAISCKVITMSQTDPRVAEREDLLSGIRKYHQLLVRFTGDTAFLDIWERLVTVVQDPTPLSSCPSDWFSDPTQKVFLAVLNFRTHATSQEYKTPSTPLVSFLELPYLDHADGFSYAVRSRSIKRLVMSKRAEANVRLTALEKAAILEDMFVW
jgi:hypothetical protein